MPRSPCNPAPRSPSVKTPDSYAITFAPIDLNEVYNLADDGANGAIVLMSGMFRNQTEGKPVECLEYQAYEPMALKVFQQIGHEIRNTWSDVTHVVIHHRTGKLAIGEISVLVAVGCPHRSEPFAACQYAIDAHPPESNPKPPESNPKPPESNSKPPESNPKPPESNPKPPEGNPKPPESNPKPPESNSKLPESNSKPAESNPNPSESRSKPDRLRKTT